MINLIESDQKVKYCMTGRKVQGFDDKNWIGPIRLGQDGAKGRFENLTEDVREIIAKQLLDSVSPIYADTYDQVLSDEFATVNQLLNTRINEIVQMTQEEQLRYNARACAQVKTPSVGKEGTDGCDKSYWESDVEFDAATNTCIKRWYHYTRGGCGFAFKFSKKEGDTKEMRIPMPSVSRADMRYGNGANKQDADDVKTALDAFTEDED